MLESYSTQKRELSHKRGSKIPTRNLHHNKDSGDDMCGTGNRDIVRINKKRQAIEEKPTTTITANSVSVHDLHCLYIKIIGM